MSAARKQQPETERTEPMKNTASQTPPATEKPRHDTSFRFPAFVADRADRLAAKIAKGVQIPRSAILREALNRGLAELERENGISDAASPKPRGSKP
jgi:predicted DNA-binding protein